MLMSKISTALVSNKFGGPPLPSIIWVIPMLRAGSFVDHSASGIATPARQALQILSHFPSQFVGFALIEKSRARNDLCLR